jgi:hypothetical protein
VDGKLLGRSPSAAAGHARRRRADRRVARARARGRTSDDGSPPRFRSRRRRLATLRRCPAFPRVTAALASDGGPNGVGAFRALDPHGQLGKVETERTGASVFVRRRFGRMLSSDAVARVALTRLPSVVGLRQDVWLHPRPAFSSQATSGATTSSRRTHCAIGCWPSLRGFDLHPAAARAGRASSVLPIADDALEAAPSALGKQAFGIWKTLTKPKQVAFCAGQQRMQSRAPLNACRQASNYQC